MYTLKSIQDRSPIQHTAALHAKSSTPIGDQRTGEGEEQGERGKEHPWRAVF